MALNAWKCEGCARNVAGSGSGFGLRAIGWYVRLREGPGPYILCPVCRPDKVPCRDNEENRGKLCAVCRAEAEADTYQLRMGSLKWAARRDEYGAERDAKVHGNTFYASDMPRNQPSEAVTDPKPPSTKDLGGGSCGGCRT